MKKKKIIKRSKFVTCKQLSRAGFKFGKAEQISPDLKFLVRTNLNISFSTLYPFWDCEVLFINSDGNIHISQDKGNKKKNSNFYRNSTKITWNSERRGEKIHKVCFVLLKILRKTAYDDSQWAPIEFSRSLRSWFDNRNYFVLDKSFSFEYTILYVNEHKRNQKKEE